MVFWFYCPECNRHIKEYANHHYMKQIAKCKECKWEGIDPVKKERRVFEKEHIDRVKLMSAFSIERQRILRLEEKLRLQDTKIIKLESRMKQILLIFHLLLKKANKDKKYSMKDLIAFIDKVVRTQTDPHSPDEPIDLVNELMK